MNSVKVPRELNFEAPNLFEEWTFWQQKIELYLLAVGLEGADKDSRKIAIALNCIGDQGLKLYNTFKFESNAKFSDVIARFKSHFEPKKT